MNRLAIRAIKASTSSHIVYLDPKGKLIDRVNIPGEYSIKIALRDDTINCTDSVTNTIYCYTLTGQEIWTFKDENVLREPVGIALDKNRNVYVAGMGTNNFVVLSADGENCRQILTKSDGLNSRVHYVLTLTVASFWYVMRMVQHLFSRCNICKLCYWTLSMLTKNWYNLL